MPNPSLIDLVKSGEYIASIWYGSESKTGTGISFWKVSCHNAFQIYEDLI